MSNENNTYRVIVSFRYPVNGITQWHHPESKITLPPHAAEALKLLGKIEDDQ